MKIMAIIKRIRLQMLRDKRALALMMVAPLLVLTLLHYLLSSETPTPILGISHLDESLIEQLESKEMMIKQYNNIENRTETIKKDELDGFLTFDNGKYNLIILNEQL